MNVPNLDAATPGWVGLVAQATDVEWRLTTHWTWAPWVTVIVVAAAIAAVVACYRYEVSSAGVGYRAALAMLRLATVALLLAMLSEAVLSGSRVGKPRLAIAVDRSDSMRRVDVASRSNDGNESTTVARLDAARGLLTSEKATVDQLAERFTIEWLAIDADVTPVGAADAKQTPSEALFRGEEASDETDPPGEASTDSRDGLALQDGSATRLGDALERLARDAAGTPPRQGPLQGVVVLTDGQATAGASLARAAESCRRAGTPLYLVGFGSETPPPSLSLGDLVADETAYVDDLLALAASVMATGLDDRPLRAELYREGRDAPVASEPVRVDPATGNATVRLIDRPTEPGEYRYTLRVTPERTTGDGSKDAASATPAELQHTVLVRDDQVRVLLVAGYPNYEYRYLKHLLERDTTIRLATHLQEADAEYTAADLTAVPRVPLALEGLAEFDAVVLLDPDPSLLPRSWWARLGQFVSERGGGLLLVAGPRHFPVAYRNQPAVVALAPTEIGRATVLGFNSPTGYRFAPTELGLRTPALALADTPDDSEAVWRSFPELYWRADVGPPKPAARVLAQAAGDGGGLGVVTPVATEQYYGAGRVLLHATDSTWRWRYRVGDTYFARYWVQTLRQLARGKRDAAASRLDFVADRRAYDPGDPVRLMLRDTRTDVDATTPPVAILRSAGRPDRRLELTRVDGEASKYTATLRDLPAGDYRALVLGSGPTPAAAEFSVVAPPGESARPQQNVAGLRAAAERTRGRYVAYTPDLSLVDLVPAARPTTLETLPPRDLWNRWPFLLAITTCLTLEWVLRKRRAML